MKLMFKLLMTAGIMISQLASANDDLKAIMKTMGKDFKALGAQITDSRMNASSLQLAGDILVQLKLAVKAVPDSVVNPDGSDPSISQTDYQNQINHVMSEIDQIVTALRANDNATAADLLNQVSKEKKADHDKYNPQP